MDVMIVYISYLNILFKEKEEENVTVFTNKSIVAILYYTILCKQVYEVTDDLGTVWTDGFRGEAINNMPLSVARQYRDREESHTKWHVRRPLLSSGWKLRETAAWRIFGLRSLHTA